MCVQHVIVYKIFAYLAFNLMQLLERGREVCIIPALTHTEVHSRKLKFAQDHISTMQLSLSWNPKARV